MSDERRKRAAKVIAELDCIASDYDRDYGLPTYGDGVVVEKMQEVLLAFADECVKAEREHMDVLRYELAKSRMMFDVAVRQLVAIKSLSHPDGFVVNGQGYTFHPPDALVRETWEAMSKAIREIDVEAMTATTCGGKP